MPNAPRLEENVEFALNPEPRCPCILLVDTSASMKGERIAALNAGLQTFRELLDKDELAKRRVEVAVVTFDSRVGIAQDFVTIDQFQPPTLSARGFTAMGGGIATALDMVKARKEQYRANGIGYYRPWVFLITDGEPKGEPDGIFEQACRRVQTEVDDKRIAFFAVGVEGANTARLAQISTQRPPLKLKGLDFREMFVWLSKSMRKVSQSRTGDQIALEPVNWGTV